MEDNRLTFGKKAVARLMIEGNRVWGTSEGKVTRDIELTQKHRTAAASPTVACA